MMTSLSDEELDSLRMDRKRLVFLLDQMNIRRAKPVSYEQARAAIDGEMGLEKKGEGPAA